MKKDQKPWSRDELIIVLGYYFKAPFGKLHARNQEIISLASLLGRTPGSVAFKLVNFASLDPTLKARGIKGAYNASKQDKLIWSEFYEKLYILSYESENLLASVKKTNLICMLNIDEEDLPKEGKVREQVVKVRVNQAFFRASILAAYNNTCCITGITNYQLLVAGHIKPWNVDIENRLNLKNGLAINGLHDKAFENGLITITPDYKIKISSTLKIKKESRIIKEYFLRYENKEIILPTRFLPAEEFLLYHNNEKFIP